MATITVSIPDDAHKMLVESFAGHFGYQPLSADGEKNPQTPEEFTRQKIVDWCKGVVRERQHNLARDAAMAAVTKQVDEIQVDIKVS